MKVACLLITRLRAKVEIRRHPGLKNIPAIILERSGGRSQVVDSTPSATGVFPGMALEEALAIRPEALVLEGNESHYHKVFARVLTSLQEISDRVEGSELGTAYVRLDGLEAVYGGEARLVNSILTAIPRDLAPRVGVAEAKFPAFVAARVSERLRATRVAADAASFLARQTVDLLPVSADLKAALHGFGLHILGDVASMTEASLIDRFGVEGRRAWHLSRGMDDSPIVPLAHAETIVECTSLPFSSASLALLLTVVDTLLARSFSRPSMRGRYAGKAILECTLETGPTWSRAFSFKGGAGSRERALSVIKARLEEGHPTGPVEEVTLTLDHLTGESGTQLGLLPEVRESDKRRLVEVDRGLRVSTGGTPALYRMVGVALWHPAPEMRALLVPVDSSSRDQVKPISSPIPVVVREGRDRQPEAMRWDNRWRWVSRIDEQWGFDLWWMSRPLTRTYYRVRGEDGTETTLFRDERNGCWYRQGA
ncbi:MAG: hypothetical protein J4G01_09025 [Dehalococcoidia bacterium]|nr:hypothetical protein [Dehalococcoidia bacterium]